MQSDGRHVKGELQYQSPTAGNFHAGTMTGLNVAPDAHSAWFAGVSDDHIPFLQQGVPSIDLIDFDFPCWHRRCDDLSAVSERSLDASGEAVLRFVLDSAFEPEVRR